MPSSDFLAFIPDSESTAAGSPLPDFSFSGSLMDRAARHGALLGDIDQRAQLIAAAQADGDQPLQLGRYRLSQMEGEQAVAAARSRAAVAETDAHYRRLADGEDLLHRAALEAPQLAARLDAETDPAAIESHAADFLSRYARVAGAPEFLERFDRIAAPISQLVATKPAALRQRYAAAAQGLLAHLDPQDPASLDRIGASPFFDLAQRDPDFARAIAGVKRQWRSLPPPAGAVSPSSSGSARVPASDSVATEPVVANFADPAASDADSFLPTTSGTPPAPEATPAQAAAAAGKRPSAVVTYGHIGTNNGFADAARTVAPDTFDRKIVVPPSHKDLAGLANAAYGRTIPQGWEQVDAAGLKKLQLQDATFYDAGSGFAAALYRDTATGAYVAAFRGTNDMTDIGPDGQQAYGLDTKQYRQAVDLARKLTAKIGGKLEFTGHSLGGGLAAAAALATDRNAVTFNAAGLHPKTLNYNNIDAAKLDHAERLITAYAIRGEPLNTFQDNNPVNAIPRLRRLKIGPAAVGFRVALDPKMDGVFSQHGMDHVFAALDDSP